jgi:hypothetical protein
MENALEKSGGRFVGFQGELGIHLLFEIAEKAQIKALKDMVGVRGGK